MIVMMMNEMIQGYSNEVMFNELVKFGFFISFISNGWYIQVFVFSLIENFDVILVLLKEKLFCFVFFELDFD